MNGCYHASRKVPKYGVFSGPYFLVFGLNTGKYGPEKTPNRVTFYTVVAIKPAEYED